MVVLKIIQQINNHRKAHDKIYSWLPLGKECSSERRKGVKISLESDFSPCSVSALHWWIGILSLVPGLQLIACVGLQLLLREDCSPLLKTFQHWLIPGAILSSIVPPPMLKQQWAAIKSMYFFNQACQPVCLFIFKSYYTHMYLLEYKYKFQSFLLCTWLDMFV